MILNKGQCPCFFIVVNAQAQLFVEYNFPKKAGVFKEFSTVQGCFNEAYGGNKEGPVFRRSLL